MAILTAISKQFHLSMSHRKIFVHTPPNQSTVLKMPTQHTIAHVKPKSRSHAIKIHNRYIVVIPNLCKILPSHAK